MIRKLLLRLLRTDMTKIAAAEAESAAVKALAIANANTVNLVTEGAIAAAENDERLADHVLKLHQAAKRDLANALGLPMEEPKRPSIH